MAEAIKFGTDGWRGIIADNFTFENVRVCAQALAGYLKSRQAAGRSVVIGYDTRFASEHFAAAAAEVLAANGIRAQLCRKATPTPVVSFNLVKRGAAGAIVITASHNPAIWNGFKIKTADGTSAPPEVTRDVEARIGQLAGGPLIERLPLDEALSRGLVEYIDPDPTYYERMGQLVDLNRLRRSSLKIVIDSMHGAGSGYLAAMLGGGRMGVTEINGERNPVFPGINPEPISPNLDKLCRTVKESGAGVGLATDGDADRIGIVDEQGRVLTQSQVFALLILYMLEVKGERGPIVKTVTTTTMAERLAALYQLPYFETSVGFRYIAPIMARENAMIGGEESGGYGFRNHIAEREGILSALCFLDLMVSMDKTPSQLISYLYERVGQWYYQRVDLKLPAGGREKVLSTLRDLDSIGGKKVVKVNRMDGLRLSFADGSWLLCRPSGTEPIIRIYAESTSDADALSLIEATRKVLAL